MIDTIKIYTMINKDIYNKIYNNAIVKSSIHTGTGEVFYEIVNDSLKGSYDSSLSVRVGSGAKYNFINNYFLEVEGSFHKIMLGYNSHNGFYNLQEIVLYLIGSLEYTYKVNLPSIQHWFLQRCDIAICYDLFSNDKVRKYINNLSLCNYPKRNIKHFQDESIYCSGTTTTLKIYNKMLEFKKHDMKKLFSHSFDINNYLHKIDGFLRFECEIKKKKLESIYNKKYIRVLEIRYIDLYNIWKEEFMKLLKIFECDLKIVRDKESIKDRLYFLYSNRQASILYNFYICLMSDGYDELKNRFSSTTFYRNIKLLKEAGIDLSQRYKLVDVSSDFIEFNPFSYEEVS